MTKTRQELCYYKTAMLYMHNPINLQELQLSITMTPTRVKLKMCMHKWTKRMKPEHNLSNVDINAYENATLLRFLFFHLIYFLWCHIVGNQRMRIFVLTLNSVPGVRLYYIIDILVILCFPYRIEKYLIIWGGGVLLWTYTLLKLLFLFVCTWLKVSSRKDKSLYKRGLLVSLFVQLQNFFSYGDVTFIGEGLQICTYARHLWPLSIEGYLACNTCCDTGHSCIMVISEDNWLSHLSTSVKQGSCHYLFLRDMSVTAGIRTPNLPHENEFKT